MINMWSFGLLHRLLGVVRMNSMLDGERNKYAWQPRHKWLSQFHNQDRPGRKVVDYKK